MAENENSERDTHFAGFARLLMQRLLDDGFDETGYRSGEMAEKIITQAAYDLVEHTLDYATDGKYEPEDIPDLKVWPDTSPR